LRLCHIDLGVKFTISIALLNLHLLHLKHRIRARRLSFIGWCKLLHGLCNQSRKLVLDLWWQRLARRR
jgi:hypothetical protein